MTGRRLIYGFWSHPTDMTRGLAADRTYLISGEVSAGAKPHYNEIGEHPEKMLFISDIMLVRVAPNYVIEELFQNI